MSNAAAGLGTAAAGLGAVTGSGALMGLGALGAMFGSDGGSGQSVQDSINAILNKALKNAINSSTSYTNSAVQTQNAFLNQAINSLTGYNQQAVNAATSNINNSLAQSQMLRQPYSTAGLNAQDAWSRSLGLATPQGGSAAMIQNQQTAQQLAPLLKSLNGNYTIGDAPTLGKMLTASDVDINSQQSKQDIINNTLSLWDQANAGFKGSSAASRQLALDQAKQYLMTGNKNVMYGSNATDPGYLAQMSRLRDNTASQLTKLYSQAQNSYVQNTINKANTATQNTYNTALNSYNQQSGQINQLNSLLQGQDLNGLATFLRGKI